MRRLNFFAGVLSAVMVAATPVTTLASPPTLLAACASNPWANIFGFQPWYACLQQKYGRTQIGSLNDIYLVVFPLVDSLIKVAALVAVGVLFFMIINMVMARGDAGKIKSAVEGMRDAIIGLIICLVAVAIVNFVAGAFSIS